MRRLKVLLRSTISGQDCATGNRRIVGRPPSREPGLVVVRDKSCEPDSLLKPSRETASSGRIRHCISTYQDMAYCHSRLHAQDQPKSLPSSPVHWHSGYEGPPRSWMRESRPFMWELGSWE